MLETLFTRASPMFEQLFIKICVTFHAKTYTNSFVFNGLSRWVAVGNPLKAFTKPLEVLGKPSCFFHYPLEVLKKAVGSVGK